MFTLARINSHLPLAHTRKLAPFTFIHTNAHITPKVCVIEIDRILELLSALCCFHRHTHAHKHTHTHTNTHPWTHRHIDTQTHMNTNTHEHKHTHNFPRTWVYQSLLLLSLYLFLSPLPFLLSHRSFSACERCMQSEALDAYSFRN